MIYNEVVSIVKAYGIAYGTKFLPITRSPHYRTRTNVTRACSNSRHARSNRPRARVVYSAASPPDAGREDLAGVVVSATTSGNGSRQPGLISLPGVLLAAYYQVVR